MLIDCAIIAAWCARTPSLLTAVVEADVAGEADVTDVEDVVAVAATTAAAVAQRTWYAGATAARKHYSTANVRYGTKACAVQCHCTKCGKDDHSTEHHGIYSDAQERRAARGAKAMAATSTQSAACATQS